MILKKIFKLITVLLLICLSYFSFANDNIINNSTFIDTTVSQTNITNNIVNKNISNANKTSGIPKKEFIKIVSKTKKIGEELNIIKKESDYNKERDAESSIRLANLENKYANIEKQLGLSRSKDESEKQANAELNDGNPDGSDTKLIQSYKQESDEKQQQTRAANALYIVRSNSLAQLSESLSKRKDKTGKQAKAELKKGDLKGVETKLIRSYKQEEQKNEECVEKQDELEKQECIEQQQTRADDAYALAKVSILNSNYKEAENYYQQAVQLNPNNELYKNSLPLYNQQLLFVINQSQPQTNSTNLAIPEINQNQSGIPQTTYTNPTIPDLNQSQPQTTFTNHTIQDLNQSKPQTTFTNPTIPDLNQFQPQTTFTNHTIQDLNQSKPQTTFTNPTIPDLNQFQPQTTFTNPTIPDLNQFQPQTTFTNHTIQDLNQSKPQTTFTNPTIPDLNQFQPQTTFTNPTIPDLNQFQPQTTFTNPTIPDLNQFQPQTTYTNPTIPNLNQFQPQTTFTNPTKQ